MRLDAKFEANFPPDTRQDIIEQVLSQVREGNFVQVVGIPGTGRSNLVGLLAYNKNLRLKHLGEKDEKSFHFVPLNFSEIRGKDTASALRFLYLGILDSLHERDLHEYGEALEKYYPRDEIDELRVVQVLKRAIDYLALEKNRKIILLFDHFEEYIPSVTDSFFAHLASLQLRARYHFSVVFFLHRPLEQLVEKEMLIDVLRLLSGRTVFLPVKDGPLVHFLLDFVEQTAGSNLPEDTKERIVEETGGNGKLVKVASEEVLRSESDSLDMLFHENRAIRSVLYEIWSIFYPEEQAMLRKLSLLKNNEMVDDDKQAVVNYLAHLDVIRDGKFTIPLFYDFVRYRVEHQLDEKMFYNDETKQIYKGEVDLTRRLTASEFSLLRFLLTKPGEIVSRDEVISQAWSKVKSTAGVTEQALDQLLFRLRQKIEDNPSEPRHLLTVKGRGITFTP